MNLWPKQVYGTESGKKEAKCISDLLLWDKKDTFLVNQNAHLEMFLQQMSERVVQAMSQFMTTKGKPPQ
ncbi:hypothetical protein T02_22 [Trichinella nativa]|uniref:Uncharacterized protein n=1 Tax=Trichinella nativa TaxID=6335 RepID=A0A0V1KSP7_9BILA|nr:hypothetical protein T02_22 [Trichinella nativa]